MSFEGIFRQATVYKGRNRDTAWYSIIDEEWPQVRATFERWLDLANFDEQGRQKRSLDAIRRALVTEGLTLVPVTQDQLRDMMA